MTGPGQSNRGMAEEKGRFLPAQVEPEEMFDVVTLTSRDTSVPGVIFVSTAMGRHGPRVKWFPERASRDAPCLVVTIGSDPVALPQGLPAAVARRAEPDVVAWVRANEDALRRFWFDGLGWTRDEVNAFLDALAKVAPG